MEPDDDTESQAAWLGARQADELMYPELSCASGVLSSV